MANIVITDGSTPTTPTDGVALFSVLGVLKYKDDSATVHEVITDQNIDVATADIQDAAITNDKLAADVKVGSLAALTTTVATSVVGAINEVDAHADTALSNVGTLASLTTTAQDSTVSAINEVDDHADTALASIATLESQIGDLDDLTTTDDESLVIAINELAGEISDMDARIDTIVAATGDDITEVVDARDGETVLTDRLDGMDDALQMTAMRLASAASIGATSVTVKHFPAAIASGVLLVIDPFTSGCEVRRVNSVSSETLSFSAALEYDHDAGDIVLLSVAGELNALWFGASPQASAATNGLAFARMVAQANITRNPRQMYIPASSGASGAASYDYDTTIVLEQSGSVYGLSLRGDGAIPRRGDLTSHGTVLTYTATDDSNAIEVNASDGDTFRGSIISDIMIECKRADGHTGCGIYLDGCAYTADVLRNVSVTQAYIGVKAQDCWGSTFRNLDVAFCYQGASINGCNVGAWIGGGCASCVGPNAIVLGDAENRTNGNAVFLFENLAIEGNGDGADGNGIVLGYTAPWTVAPEHDAITIRNCYFENNDGPYEIKCGEDDIVGAGGKVRVRQLIIQNNQFYNGIFLGDTCQDFLVGPNKFRTAAKITLGTKTSDAFGTIIGRDSLISSAADANWGNTWSINFIDPYAGAFYSQGIQGTASSKNLYSGLRTPKVTSLEVTTATVSWRDLGGATLLLINHGSATNFTQISNCPDYTVLMLMFVTANTTVKHNTSYIVLRGGADYAPAANEILTLVSSGGVLYEVSRTAA